MLHRSSAAFWKTKTLAEMSAEEWESLCDGCGRCCLHKLRDDETGALTFTNVACRLLDLESCRCSDYVNRRERVPDCVGLTPQALDSIDWLPPSCAYRRLAEGRGLAWWHPLVSGDPATVHAAGVSVRGRAVDERRAGPLEHHAVEWPRHLPRGRRADAPGAAGRAAAPQAPAVQAPALQVPVTQVPVTQAPVTQAPVTQAPVTQVPVTQVPVTRAPVTRAPVTRASVRQAPAMQAPATQTPIPHAQGAQAPAPHAPVPRPAAPQPGQPEDRP